MSTKSIVDLYWEGRKKQNPNITRDQAKAELHGFNYSREKIVEKFLKGKKTSP